MLDPGEVYEKQLSHESAERARERRSLRAYLSSYPVSSGEILRGESEIWFEDQGCVDVEFRRNWFGSRG